MLTSKETLEMFFFDDDAHAGTARERDIAKTAIRADTRFILRIMASPSFTGITEKSIANFIIP